MTDSERIALIARTPEVAPVFDALDRCRCAFEIAKAAHERELKTAKNCLLELFRWQAAEVNELMPDGLGDRIRDVLGDDVIDDVLENG